MQMMRVSWYVAVCLAWLCAIACSADLHATTMLPGEPVDAGQPGDGSRAFTLQAVAIWDQTATWIWTKQNEFLLQLTQELGSMRGQNSVGWALVLMSFVYGVLHAAGPGHGKVVLTTYLVTHRSRLNRGIAMGAAAAYLQGVTALLIVYIPIGLAGRLPIETESATLWATRVSFAMLALVGLYLLIRAARALPACVRQLRRETGEVRHDHADHGDGEGGSCRHLPSPTEIDSAGSRHAAAGLVLAIGLRPCTGAVFVLVIAAVMDLIWHGALSVIAMSTGTAITIVTLAVIATKARDLASEMVAHRSPLWTLAATGLGAVGGALLLLMALWALNASFVMNHIVDL